MRTTNNYGLLVFAAFVLGACGSDTSPTLNDAGSSGGDGSTSSDAGVNTGGDGGVGVDVEVPPVEETYQPLGIGASWTYHVVDPVAGTEGDQTDALVAYEDVGGQKTGTMAFHYHKDKISGGTSDSWYGVLGTAIVIHRDINISAAGITTDEEFYDPARIRVDEDPAHLVQGVTWTETFQKTNIDPVTGTVRSNARVIWTVEAVDEMVTVPAGTFSCIRLRRDAGAAPKTYWFARGVGKVKEQGQQTEELISYTLP